MWKRLGCMLLVLAAAAAPWGAVAEDARGFETPRACAQAVFDALAAQDMAALDNCFAFAEVARRYDFVKFCERLNALAPLTSLLPATGPLNIAYNEAKLRHDFYYRLAFATLMLNRPALAPYLQQGGVVVSQNENYADVMRMMQEASTMACWGELTLVTIATPQIIPDLAEKFYSDLNQRNLVKQTAPWGMNEFEELILMLGLPAPDERSPSGMLVMPLQFVRADGGWLANPIGSNASSLLGISPMNMVAPLEP